MIEQPDKMLQEFHYLLDNLPKNKVDKLNAFYARMLKQKRSVFTFLFDYDVLLDNNGSERAIRNNKMRHRHLD